MISAVLVALLSVPAEVTTNPDDDAWVVLVGGTQGGSSGSGGHSSNSPYEFYAWRLACTGPPGPMCGLNSGCEDDLLPHNLYGLRHNQWELLASACRGGETTSTPTVTPILVSRAFQRIPLPHLRAIPQPPTKTLVNFDTIFRVEATPLTRRVTLLGQQVELAITPTSFDWTWGDGTTTTTTSPGAAYPRKDVVHRYLDADVTVRASVTVTWSARWRVNGGSWGDVPGNVRTTGPAASLRVVEAVPRLSETG